MAEARITFGTVFLGVTAMVFLVGCAPSIDTRDLGTIVFEIPEVPGADRPFELPPEAGPSPPEPTLRE